MDEKRIAVGAFKQSCLKDMEEVRRTKHPLLVTKHGKPFVMVVPIETEEQRPNWRGALSDTGEILGDVLSPAVPAEEWESA